MKNLLFISSLLLCITCFAKNPKDTTYKSIKLKDGYTFAYKRHDSIIYACLIKDGKETELSEDESDTGMSLEVLGYPYADFGKTFVLATHVETNPIKIEVLDKSTGGMLMYGATPFYMDTIKRIMMFEGTGRRWGKLILYDFNSGKSELYIAPHETPCFCCFCWKVISLTDAEIKIEYLNMKYEKVIKSYSRK